MSQTFTIISKGARLVEVEGDGPTTDTPDGLTIPDGLPTIAPVSLHNGFRRRFRVDAPANVQATVSVTDSPYGVFVGVRGCAPYGSGIRRIIATDWIDRWPRIGGALRRRAPSVLALWQVLTDDVQPCTWHNIGDDSGSTVTARGGDLVVLNFVSP